MKTTVKIYCTILISILFICCDRSNNKLIKNINNAPVTIRLPILENSKNNEITSELDLNKNSFFAFVGPHKISFHQNVILYVDDILIEIDEIDNWYKSKIDEKNDSIKLYLLIDKNITETETYRLLNSIDSIKIINKFFAIKTNTLKNEIKWVPINWLNQKMDSTILHEAIYKNISGGINFENWINN